MVKGEITNLYRMIKFYDYKDFDGENKPLIYKKIDEIIKEYRDAIKEKDKELEVERLNGINEESRESFKEEEGREIAGIDYINVWLYYSRCKDACGVNEWWNEELYNEYMNYITTRLEV